MESQTTQAIIEDYINDQNFHGEPECLVWYAIMRSAGHQPDDVVLTNINNFRTELETIVDDYDTSDKMKQWYVKLTNASKEAYEQKNMEPIRATCRELDEETSVEFEDEIVQIIADAYWNCCDNLVGHA
jgi:hypothetical protein